MPANVTAPSSVGDGRASRPDLAVRLFAFLTSLRGALAGTAALVVATVVAVGLASGGAALARSEGSLGGVAQFFELKAPFESWWFALALWCAGLVGVANTLAGLGLLSGKNRLPIRLRATVNAALHHDLVERSLKTHGRVLEDDDGTLVAERGLAGRAARLLAGVGALGMAGGIAFIVHGGISGFATVAEGGTVYGYERKTPSGLARFDLGLELQVERAPAPKGSADQGPLRVTLGRGSDVLAQASLGMGEGLSFAGWNYSLDGQVPGEGPGRFLLSVDGGPIRSVAAREPFKADDGTELVVVGYESGDPRSPVGARVPAVRVARVRPGLPADIGWVYGGAEDFDQQVRRAKPVLRLHGYERRQELRVRIEWPASRLPLYLGAIFLLVGLALFAGRGYARFEAQPTPSGWVVRAESDGRGAELGAELDTLIAALQAQAAALQAQGALQEQAGLRATGTST